MGHLKEDKVKAPRLVAHSNSNFVLNLNGQPIILIHSYGALKKDVRRALCEEKFMRTFFSDRKSTRLNSSHSGESRMPSSA